jgi:aryl-alcohol dehydrogenase-like predicted oxidoreductase
MEGAGSGRRVTPDPSLYRHTLDIGLRLSPLTFGSMGLKRAGDVQAASRLLSRALDRGVTTFHVSQEYESWPLFVEAWTALGVKEHVNFIAKVASPHFGETAFSPTVFQNKIETYCRALRIPRLDVVQWLLRLDLKQEERRLEAFERDGSTVGETVVALKDSGEIGCLVSFPYTRGIAQQALAAPWCSGLALYLNPLELEMVDLLDQAADAGKAVIAIRPFGAGRVLNETGWTAEQAISFALAHPAVTTVVAGLSSTDRLENAATAACRSIPSLTAWRQSLQDNRID